RMYVCGQDATGAGTITSWGAQAALDGTDTFTTIGRFRKVFQPGADCIYPSKERWRARLICI
ncbi:MAG: hypothetical protein V4521_12415, partial [Pseudomonadota bacterium]